jgi:hypothetical protein
MDTTEEFEIEYEEADTRSEVITQCYNAIAAVEMLDPITKSGQERKRRILNKSLRVIDFYITQIHDEVFEDQED